MKPLFKSYLKELSDTTLREDARGENFCPALATLFQEVSEATDRPHVHVTTLAKVTGAGSPDFRPWNGTDRIIAISRPKSPRKSDFISSKTLNQLQTDPAPARLFQGIEV